MEGGVSGVIAQLHVHSHYSFFDSTLSPEDVARLAAERGFGVAALTDTNSLAGATAFYKACRERSVQPILGAEVDDPRRPDERALVLVRDAQGWAELCRLISTRHLQGHREPAVERTLGGVWVKGGGERPRRDALSPTAAVSGYPPSADAVDALATPDAAPAAASAAAAFSQAPGFTTAAGFSDAPFDLAAALCELDPAHTIVLTDSPELLARLARRRDGIEDALYGELILLPERRRRCRETYECARALGIPLVATRDVHFGDPADQELHRILRAMARGSTLGRLAWDAPAETVGEAAWYCGPEVLREQWRGLAGPCERAIERIARACRFELPLGVWKFPLPHLDAGETFFSRLWKLGFEGMQRRYRPLTRESIERLAAEIEVIDRLGFSAYFLVVHEIAEAARGMGLHVLGRGSAANALVSHALGFTGVDPLRHQLYFERFLNPERGSPPDIDLDFSWKDRDALVDWVFERFGRDRVALISTTVRLRLRQAIREVGKALGLPNRRISALTRALPWAWSHSGDIERLEREHPQCRDLPLREEPWATVLAHARRLLGFPTHYGIHCGGLIIAPRPITHFVPLVRAAKGFVVTQMDMFPVEELGLIKIDLLGNRSLGVYKDTLRMIAENAQAPPPETPTPP
jgi:DNA polymerase III alpha subunit